MKHNIYIHFIHGQGWSDWAKGFISVHSMYKNRYNVIPLYESNTSLSPWVDFANIDKYRDPVNVNVHWQRPEWYQPLRKELIEPLLNTNGDTHLAGIGCTPKSIDKGYEYLYIPIPSVLNKIDEICSEFPKRYQCLHIRCEEVTRNNQQHTGYKKEHIAFFDALKKVDEIKHLFDKPTIVISDSPRLKSMLVKKYPNLIISPSIPLHSGYNTVYSFNEAVGWFLDTAIVKHATNTIIIRALFNTDNNGIRHNIGGHFASFVCQVHQIPYTFYNTY